MSAEGRRRRTALAIAFVLAAVAPPALGETITYENETTPYPGLRVLERHTSNPSWRIHVAFVSLCHEGVHVAARSSQSVRITAAAWGDAMGAQLAVNGDFYRTDRTAPTVYGDAVGVGLHWPIARTGLAAEFEDEWYYRDYGWIAFGEGWAEFTHSKWVKQHADELEVTQGWYPRTLTTEIPPNTNALVSGFPELVVEGQALSDFPDRSDTSVRHPRTAMGLTADRSTFILAVVDGRSTASVGMTGAELASLMAEMGAYTAFNLDGGGSSQMWLRGSGTLNDPSDGSPRAVANHWGVFAGTGHDLGADPGSCFAAGGCFPSPLPAAADSAFRDMPATEAGFDEALLVVDRELLDTCQSDPVELFCPHCALSRRDAVTLIVRAAGADLSDPPATPTFADVPATDPSYAEIEAAARAGLTSGCGDGRFCPDGATTRAAMAAFIARARGWSEAPPASPTFDDVPADHPLFAEIEAMVAHCVSDGCGESSFCPSAAVERAEGAVLGVRGFNLDGDNPCADSAAGVDAGPGFPPATDAGLPSGDGDGAPEEQAGNSLAGGCHTAGQGSNAYVLIACLLLALRASGARRRRSR